MNQGNLIKLIMTIIAFILHLSYNLQKFTIKKKKRNEKFETEEGITKYSIKFKFLLIFICYHLIKVNCPFILQTSSRLPISKLST